MRHPPKVNIDELARLCEVSAERFADAFNGKMPHRADKAAIRKAIASLVGMAVNTFIMQSDQEYVTSIAHGLMVVVDETELPDGRFVLQDPTSKTISHLTRRAVRIRACLLGATLVEGENLVT